LLFIYFVFMSLPVTENKTTLNNFGVLLLVRCGSLSNLRTATPIPTRTHAQNTLTLGRLATLTQSVIPLRQQVALPQGTGG
jgi:hypothetical protein